MSVLTTTNSTESAAPLNGPLLTVKDLVMHYPKRSGGLLKRNVGTIHAVCGVSFEINAGETLGLVGEAGCGKTTTRRAILQLIKPTSGSVKFRGRELVGSDKASLAADRKSTR